MIVCKEYKDAYETIEQEETIYPKEKRKPVTLVIG